MKKTLLLRGGAILFLILLLLMPGLSVEGACQGLLLWFQVVLPTLSPFIIGTQAILALDGVSWLMKPFYPILKKVFRLSLPGAYILLCGFLCGYPLGARLCAQMKLSGKITPTEANYLLSISNHPSPMFLLGYVCSQVPFQVNPGILLLCLYLPVIPLSFFSRKYYGIRLPENMPKEALHTKSLSLEDIIFTTADTMVLIGGYIMLFSILAKWIVIFPFLSTKGSAFLTGIAEITTGVNRICSSFPPRSILFFLIPIVAFGGISGIFQTKSVIKNAGLSIRHYVLWKGIHSGLSLLILIIIQQLLPHLW